MGHEQSLKKKKITNILRVNFKNLIVKFFVLITSFVFVKLQEN